MTVGLQALADTITAAFIVNISERILAYQQNLDIMTDAHAGIQDDFALLLGVFGSEDAIKALTPKAVALLDQVLA